jgi:drug/metabolite transporter (DMT)-like permease
MMKFKVEAECTPEEARAFLGLPDVTPLNDRLVAEMQARMEANITAMQPEELMKSWTAFGLLNARWMRRHPEVDSTLWANWLGVAAGVGSMVMWLVAGSDVRTLAGRPDFGLFLAVCAVTGIGAAWVASVLWNVASRRLSTSLAGQLIVSETVFALVYAFAWDGQWPAPLQLLACVLFVAGILASIKAHQ